METEMETTTDTRTVLPFVTGAGPVSAAQAAAVMRAVASIASPDLARGVLAGVHVEPDGDSVRFTATDSYRLLTVSVPVNENGVAFDPFTVSAKELAAAAKNVKKSETCSLIYSAGDTAATFSNGVDSFRIPTIVGTFADWRRLVTAAEPGSWPAAGETATMNAVYLAGLLDSFATILAGGGRARGEDCHRVRFSQMSPTKPTMMTATAGAVTATGLIMSIRQ